VVTGRLKSARSGSEFYFRKADTWIFIGVVRIVPAEAVRESIAQAARTAASRL
jgi:hypothetical protein